MARKVMVNGLDIGYIPPSSASDVIYNNQSSGLASTVVQSAIDEISNKQTDIFAGEHPMTIKLLKHIRVYFTN